MSWLSSITGQDAANAAGKDAAKNAKIKGKYGDLFENAYQDYKKLHPIFGGDNPMAAIFSSLNTLNENPSQRTQQFANGANEAANAQATQTANFLKSQGFGDGLIGGAAQGAFQNAATQTNQYAAQQMDPQEQLRRILAYLQAQQSAEAGPLNLLSMAGNGVYGAPAPAATSSPLLGILGAFTGSYASALGSGLGGKK